jgi:hypothetical protein
MFAIAALLCFLLAMFGAHIGTLNLMLLGLAFLSAHFVFAGPLLPSWPRRQ